MASSDSLGEKSENAVKGEKGKIDMSGLAEEWEAETSIRQRLQMENWTAPLMDDQLSECIKHACLEHVHSVLKILIIRIAPVALKPQPEIKPLRAELTRLYKKVGRTPDEAIIVNDSWLIRKMYGFVKRNTRLLKVSTASCLLTRSMPLLRLRAFRSFACC